MARAAAPLHAVTDSDKPAKRKTITEAAESGTRREMLASMRLRITQALDDPKCHPRDLASLTRRLDDIDEKIRAIDAVIEGDDIDEAASTPDEEWSAN